MAQVLPVLGVGLVIEFRILATGGRFKARPTYRRVQSVAFTLAALGLANGTVTALRALRYDESPTAVSATTALMAAQWAAAVLILSPILDLAIGLNADALTWPFGLSPKRWWARWKIQRAFLRGQATAVRVRGKAAEALATLEPMIKETEETLALLAALPRPWTKKQQDSWTTASDWLTGARETRHRLRESFREIIREEVNFAKFHRVAMRRLREAMKHDAALSKVLARDILETHIPGVRSTATYTTAQPDDGGFLHDVPVERRYRYRSVDYIVLDPEDFAVGSDAATE